MGPTWCASAGCRSREGDEPVADACVTAEPGVVLAILTADCLPVVFAAEDGSEIGAAHAGWRGLAQGVLEEHGGRDACAGGRRWWHGWVRPPGRAYEIGAEVLDAFVAQDGTPQSAFAPTRPGHWRVDLMRWPAIVWRDWRDARPRR